MSTHVLGISAFFHDSAVALLRDGEIVAAAQEERFTRIKGDPSFPTNAVEFCLEQGGLDVSQLDYVAFYERPLLKFERILETHLAFPDAYGSFRESMSAWAPVKLHLRRIIERELGRGFRGQLCFTDHHESHAASAFFPSPFPEAAILTLDAVGEWDTSSIGIGRGNEIRLTHSMRFPHSLGMLYSAFTYYTGFKVNSGEYKLMGLAPYGEPRYVDLIVRELVDVKEDGSLHLNMAYFDFCRGGTITSERFHALFGGAPRHPESFITQKEMDLAASVQAVCEDIVLRAARHAQRLTSQRALVMAGGVALNCVANGRLLREGPFDDLWIQPAAGDAGGALGAALVVWHHMLGRPRSPRGRDGQSGSFLGPAFDGAVVESFLDHVGASYDRIDDERTLLERVARLLSEGKVVGWFHGRMEYGPRALGARSILGDARSPRMQQTMNVKIKFRESFRPFAPSVLAECVDTVFDMGAKQESPYMLLVAPVKESCRVPLTEEDRARMRDPDLRIRVSVPRSSVPAVTHVDYSARIQTVDAERHGRYYRLLRAFYDLTGCPVLVNTSFNVRGEPIVSNPEEAFRCFMATEMDCLVLEDCLLMKEDQPASVHEQAERYQVRYAPD